MEATKKSKRPVPNPIHQNPGRCLEEQSSKAQQRCGYSNLVVSPMRLPEEGIEYRQHNTDGFSLKEVRSIKSEPALQRG